MRPRTLDECIGQDHIIGPGRLLRRAIEADRLSSLLLHGPPGTGKTTLARVISRCTRARFVALNAVLAGVKDIRTSVAEARQRRDDLGQRTILFIDEVHRWSKSQQDALLPWVENGTVVLVGATTENPFFEVNKALVSRSRIFQLRPLESRHLRAVLDAALADRERGYGARAVALAEDAAAHLVDVANGDARTALNALELAVETTPPDESGTIRIGLAVAEESIQRRAVLYDREGDAHFDTISAFLKSVRGGDPDAALYWLARMVAAGEDPRFIFRRLIILASEDIGLADPQALGVVMSCAQAFDRIGMPEGRFPLSQATIYLSVTKKSNSTMAVFDALKSVASERGGDVPNHLKDSSRDKEGFGHGKGYLYPHAYRDHWVAQQYLPAELRGRTFWQPSNQGWEGQVGPRIARQREAQLAAMVEESSETWTFGPSDARLERWVQRTKGQASARLSALRDAVFDAAGLVRHHVVLDVEPGTGLLTWEALRRVPEGGVFAWSARSDRAQALTGLAERLPELSRPTVITGALPGAAGAVRFDRVLGRDVLTQAGDASGLARALRALLLPEGRLVFVESLRRRTQRLSALVEGPSEWAAAEDALYADGPMMQWTAERLCALFNDAGWSVETDEIETSHALFISEQVAARWLADRPDSYIGRLARGLPDTEPVRQAVRRLVGQTVRWRSVSLRIIGR